MTPTERLFVHGFLRKGYDEELVGKTASERKKKLKNADPDTKKKLLSYVDEEILEIADEYFSQSGYPNSIAYYKLVHESPTLSLENAYFWIMEHMRLDRGFFDIVKVYDEYSASEASAFWGNQQQRINAQQNQVQGLLANIGKFVKELFQMVRELRIIEERLHAYEHWKESKSADITLKSIFTDLVEGGTKSPQSVFGLAQTVGFTILPDLFFNTHVYSVKELDDTLKEMTYNTSVKNVLRRKLYQFIQWKEKTHVELKNRRRFNIKYLRQHMGIIQTYMRWAKPYLRNVQRLQMRDMTKDPEVVSSFDTNLQEVELIFKKKPKQGVYPVVLVSFRFRSRPEMAVRREYQQGPAHMGRLQMDFRAYAWTDKDIERYKELRHQEDLELIGLLDAQLADVMEELGDDLMRYIKEKEDELPKEDEKKESTKKPSVSSQGAIEPFIALFGGFADMFNMFIPARKISSKSSGPTSDAYSAAGSTAAKQCGLLWHIYKKAHRLISW